MHLMMLIVKKKSKHSWIVHHIRYKFLKVLKTSFCELANLRQ